MARSFRPRLGMVLQNSVMPGDQPTIDMGDLGQMPPGLGMSAPEKKVGFFKEGGMGRTLAGLIGDALLQNADMAPVYAPMQRQRQAIEAEEAQWTRRRAAEREDKQWEWQNRPREDAIPPILRDAQAWQGMTPEQRAAYGEMQKARAGDPDVTLTLPNGQLYVGPKSGIQAALGGSAPKPVGKLTPINNGGPTPPASGNFRR